MHFVCIIIYILILFLSLLKHTSNFIKINILAYQSGCLYYYLVYLVYLCNKRNRKSKAKNKKKKMIL